MSVIGHSGLSIERASRCSNSLFKKPGEGRAGTTGRVGTGMDVPLGLGSIGSMEAALPVTYWNWLRTGTPGSRLETDDSRLNLAPKIEPLA